jgi:hypothetical protein
MKNYIIESMMVYENAIAKKKTSDAQSKLNKI